MEFSSGVKIDGWNQKSHFPIAETRYRAEVSAMGKRPPKQQQKQPRSSYPYRFIKAVGEPGVKGYIEYWGKKYTATFFSPET